jgi:hypothetical protein
MKDGKPVLVEWGSVAGEKKVGPKQPAPKPGTKPKEKPKPEQPKPQQSASSAPDNADSLVREEKKRDLLPG